MSSYPEDLKYLDSHEYVRLDGDIVTVGITQYAVNQLGDIVFVELPEAGTTVEKGDIFGSVESVKAVETLYSPVSGTVIESNQALNDSPEITNEDPYIDGWFIKVRLSDSSEIDSALTADQYSALVEGQ
jgi:glycine cleavage system H protein